MKIKFEQLDKVVDEVRHRIYRDNLQSIQFEKWQINFVDGDVNFYFRGDLNFYFRGDLVAWIDEDLELLIFDRHSDFKNEIEHFCRQLLRGDELTAFKAIEEIKEKEPAIAEVPEERLDSNGNFKTMGNQSTSAKEPGYPKSLPSGEEVDEVLNNLNYEDQIRSLENQLIEERCKNILRMEDQINFYESIIKH